MSQTDGVFQVGPTGGTCLDVWSSPETVENAHDTETDQQVYRGALRNNATRLAAAPEANR